MSLDDPGEEWVEAASCTWPHQAAFLRSVLDAAGIAAVIPNEQTLGVQPLYGQLLGGVRVLVHARDLRQAQELLQTAAAESRNNRADGS
jgi:hypothetical protein